MGVTHNELLLMSSSFGGFIEAVDWIKADPESLTKFSRKQSQVTFSIQSQVIL